MSGGFRVRAGRPAHLEAVLALERATATAPHWAAAVYGEILAAAGVGEGVARCLVVAEEEAGEILGFAVGAVVGAEAELESVVVAEGARRRGLGRALCVAVSGWAREQGAERMELEVRAGSAGARALYGSLGFVEVGRRPRYYSGPEEDAVVMRLRLAVL